MHRHEGNLYSREALRLNALFALFEALHCFFHCSELLVLLDYIENEAAFNASYTDGGEQKTVLASFRQLCVTPINCRAIEPLRIFAQVLSAPRNTSEIEFIGGVALI